MKNPRELWLPKLKPLPVQCVSCPFREGNDKEFQAVLTKLKHFGNPTAHGFMIDPMVNRKTDVSLKQAQKAKAMVKEDTSHYGDFHCHQSVYDQEMQIKPIREHKQCPGASANFIAAGVRK